MSDRTAALEQRSEDAARAAVALRRLADETAQALSRVDVHHDGRVWQGPAADQSRQALDARLQDVSSVTGRLRDLAGDAETRARWLRDRAITSGAR